MPLLVIAIAIGQYSIRTTRVAARRLARWMCRLCRTLCTLRVRVRDFGVCLLLLDYIFVTFETYL